MQDRLDIETFFNTKDEKRFFFPGKLLWSKGCRYRLFDIIESGTTVALFVDLFFEKSEFVTEMKQRLGEQLILFEIIDGMPKTKNIKRIAAALGTTPDIVVSLGGGSTIDTAKAVTADQIYGAFEGVGIGSQRGMKTLEGAHKPIFVSIPTTAGTGADASRYYAVYDSETGEKVYGKSWKLIADWTLLDSYFIRYSPESLLVNSAFDTFIHSFESFICKNERSWFGDMLSLDGMVRAIGALDKIINHKELDEKYFLELLYAATLAGMAISNIRTGNIHEAAGALLEHTRLSHPETLLVFLRTAYEQYSDQILDREEIFVLRMKESAPELDIDSFRKAISWWEDVFDRTGIASAITKELSGLSVPKEELKKHIFNRVFDDKVWINKESPRPLDERLIHELVDRSLAQWGL